MKLKGVSTFEQYVEKIVLAVVSVVLLGVIAVQALVQPNRIKVGSNPPVPPGQAYYAVQEKANAVKGKISDTMPPGRPEVSPQPLAEKFQEQFRAPVAPNEGRIAMGAPLTVTGAEVTAMQAGGSIAPIAPLAVPAPVAPAAYAGWQTLDPLEVASSPELQKLVGTEQPFDKASVTVEATFDGTALRRALLTDPDGDAGPTRAVPSQWWSQLAVFGVRLEREELTGTGEWTGLTQVAAPPGRLDLAGDLGKQALSAADIEEWVRQAEQYSEEVRRPEFYGVLAGRPWMPPVEAMQFGGGARPAEVDRDMRARADLERQRVQVEQAITNRGGAPSRGPEDLIGGGKGGAGNRQPANQPTDRKDPQLVQLERRLKSIEDELAKVDGRILALGFDPLTGEAKPPEAPTGNGREVALLEDAKVRVWTHDMTAEPGKTYRYRVSVLVNNPAFGRGASMVPEQQDMAKPAVVASAASEWTVPVLVPPETAYFVTSASEGGDLGGEAGASVEVYRMFYGFYRRGTARLEPGDAVVTQVDLPTKVTLPIWDVEKLKQLGPGGAPTATPGQGKGQPEDIILPPPGRTTTAPGRGNPPPGPGEAEPAPLPEGATPWNKPIMVALQTVLLDVARTPVVLDSALGGGRARSQAYLRSATGAIEVRVPDDERDSDLYQRLAASAKDGETQGQPVGPAEVKPIPIPGLPRPRGDGGGGGGGGGG